MNIMNLKIKQAGRLLLSLLVKLGVGIVVACQQGLLLVIKPVYNLFLGMVRKGNRAAERLVHAIRRFAYIGRRYGYKRAFGLTAYRLEKLFTAHAGQMKQGFVRFAPMALAAVVLMVSIQCWTAFTLAYEVNYDGNSVGYVADESVVADACELIRDRVVEESFAAKNVVYSLKVVTAASLNDATEICENIIEVSDEIQTAVGLYVDKQLVAVCEDGQAIEAAMQEVAAVYTHHEEEETVSFANDIEYISGLYPVHKIRTSINGKELADVLTVMMTVRETYTKEIAYKTEEVEEPSRYIGYRSVQTKGVKGQKEITADVSYVNGKEIERQILQETVTKQPVNEVIAVGSKRYSKASNTDTGTTLFWPVAGSDVTNISSYFGDGRNHKGLDILAPSGTPIYAAEDGVVTYVGWESGYGYYLIISHDSGLQTLYAHCSSVSAQQGQQVTRGDYIAAVGITGRASAYHCHFEVRVGGSAVNACPYLGLD